MTPLVPVDVTPGEVGSFQTVDISSHVGNDSGSVSFAVLHVINTSEASGQFGVRKNGSTDNLVGTLPGNGHDTLFVGVDANNTFQAQVADGMEVWLTGYLTTAEAYSLTDAVEKTVLVDGTWVDIDISSERSAAGTPKALGAVFLIHNTQTASSRTAGFRPNGSTDERGSRAYVLASGLRGVVIGVDENELCEHYVVDAPDLKCYLIGWIFDNAVFLTDAASFWITGSGGEYTENDLSGTVPSGANGVFYHSYNEGGNGYKHAVRKSGSSYGDDQYDNSFVGSNAFGWVEVDPSARAVEQSKGFWQAAFWVCGWTLPSDGLPPPTSPASRARLMKVIS